MGILSKQLVVSERVPDVVQDFPLDETRSWQTEIEGVINSVGKAPLIRPDADIRNKKDRLIALCRSEAGKEGFVSGFVSHAKDSIIGEHGIKLQSMHPNPSVAEAIEAAWLRWNRSMFCDVADRRDLIQMEYALVDSLMTDGEFIAIERPSQGRYQLQVVDPRLLDVNYNTTSIRGNPVNMGVETDQLGKPLFYHFTSLEMMDQRQDGYELTSDRGPVLPAEQVIHVVNEKGGAIIRGVPHLAATAAHWGALRQYQEAVLVRARHEAQRMGFIVTPGGGEAPNTDLEKLKAKLDPKSGQNKKKKPKPRRNFKNGAIMELEPGKDIRDFANSVPNSVYPDYIRTVLHSVAAGLDVGYHTVSGDMSDSNFSSARMGEQKTRATWRRFQGLVIYKFLDRVFRNWMLFEGQNIPNLADPSLLLEALRSYTFVPKAFEYIQPKEMAQANALDIQNGLKSRREIVTSEGRDYDKTQKELKDEEAAGMGNSGNPIGNEVVAVQ